MVTDTATKTRPGCVTAYAVVVLVGGLAALGTLPLMLLPALAGDRGSLVFLVLLATCAGILSLIPISTAIGLWRMRSWGWWLFVVTHSLGLAGVLISLVFALFAANEGQSLSGEWMLGSISSLALGGGVLYWFLTNRHQFGVGAAAATLDTKGRSSVPPWAVVLIAGAAVLVCLLPVVLIAGLSLLGPEIQAVFSEITRSLSAP
jgi:hypothetical protein